MPTTGNGDIKTIYDAKKMLDETGCDAIMIGRGCLGNPWFIKEVLEYIENNKIIPTPTYEERIKMILKHLDLLLEYNDEKKAILEMRSNVSYYLKGMPNSIDVKKEIYKVTSKNEFVNIFLKYLENLKNV